MNDCARAVVTVATADNKVIRFFVRHDDDAGRRINLPYRRAVLRNDARGTWRDGINENLHRVRQPVATAAERNRQSREDQKVTRSWPRRLAKRPNRLATNCCR